MGEKLRLITNPIPWSLLLKSLAVVAAWLILPWWGFVMVVAFCYLYPFFRVMSLAVPLASFLFLSWYVPHGFLEALCAAIVFFLILGIKDLVIVNRKFAYGLLVMLLFFGGSFLLFSEFGAWSSWSSFFVLAALVFVWSWLVRFSPDHDKSGTLPLTISALILFEIGVVTFFLPLSFLSQATLLFLGSVLLFEAATSDDVLTLKQVLVWGGTYALISLLVALLVPWKV